MLQADWSMRRLRPNSVSSGCTETQFDLTPQSPQPSQTARVDEDALVGVGILAALAPPPLLRGAGLIVDQHGDAVDRRQLLLDRDEFVARADDDAFRPARRRRIFADVVGDDDDALGAVGDDLRGDLRRVEPALVALAAGHRHRVVEQDLVGDVDLGVDRPAQGERAGMIVGAVAEILEHVAAGREMRFADPVRAFAAHLGEALGGAVHEQRHEMAADAGVGARAFGHDRSSGCAGSRSRNRACAPPLRSESPARRGSP